MLQFANNRIFVRCLSAGFQKLLIISEHDSHIGMVRSESTNKNDKTSLIEGLGLGVLPLGLIEARQVVEVDGHVGVIGPQGLFINPQGALVAGFGLSVFPLGFIQVSQVVEANCDGRVVGT